MYRFLMVDDEELIRRGFETKIDWEGAGFEFLPPCENGRDAMAAIDELEPDIVMTDIHMPHADGISVAAHVMERHPGIVVVILSGYDEFNYAQAAIRNKVFDYVLKPVSSRELLTLLSKIKAKLDADRRSREDENALKLQAELSGAVIRNRSLEAFLEGSADGPLTAEAAVPLFGFDPGPLSCAVLVVERDAGGTDDLRSRLELALRQARRSTICFPSEHRTAALVLEPDADRSSRVARAVAEALLGGDHPGLSVGVGRSYERWIDAPRSYAEAASALAYRLVREPSRPFLYVQGTEDRDALNDLRTREQRLCLAVRTGAVVHVPELARSYAEALNTAGLSPQGVRHEVFALFSRIHDEFAHIGVSATALSAKLATDYFRYVESLGTAEAVMAALLRLAEVAASTFEAGSLHVPEWKVLDFKEHVARHYAEKDLSIGKVAERLSISESYLSKLLRRMLGISFVEYLSDYRIERAKELLATSDMLAYEVAEAVGYADARYFASLFKKKTGLTSSEYRQSLGGASKADGT